MSLLLDGVGAEGIVGLRRKSGLAGCAASAALSVTAASPTGRLKNPSLGPSAL